MSYPNSQKQMFINMREKLYSLKGIVSRALLLVTMVALCCYSANAAGASADDPVVLENGGSYTIGYSAWYAVYSVPEDVTVDNMVIEIVSPVRSLDIYSDADYSASVNPTVAGNFSPYTFTYTIPNGTAQGTKFYVMKPFDIQDGKLPSSAVLLLLLLSPRSFLPKAHSSVLLPTMFRLHSTSQLRLHRLS